MSLIFTMDDPYLDHYDPELYFIAHDPKFMDHERKFYRSRSEILWIMIRNLWIIMIHNYGSL